MRIHFQLDFGGCLFGVFFDDHAEPYPVFCICIGPLVVAFERIPPEDDVVVA